jgi:hypothetical protein
VWLGPQTTWSRNWPPPKAWNASAATDAKVVDGALVLTVPDADAEWPHLTRLYRWFEGRLHCEVRISGGERNAQIIQILQVPSLAEIDLRAERSADVPRGYTQVHLGRTPSPVKKFDAPPHVTEDGDKLHVKFADKMEKLGFVAQPIVARLGKIVLRVDRGRSEGVSVGTPDEGFVTQIYLGSARSPVIELEQMSPLWAAANNAVSEIILEAQIEDGAGAK